MKMTRKPIKNKIIHIIIPMVFFICVILTGIIYIVKTNKSTFKEYTDKYYHATVFVTKLSDFMVTMDDYEAVVNGIDYEALTDKYEKQLRPASEELFRARFDYSNQAYHDIEEIHDIISDDFSKSLILITSSPEEYITLRNLAATVYNRINMIIATEISDGNQAYNASKVSVYVCEGLMIAALIAFAAYAVFIILYIRLNIFKPIIDVSEWAKLFHDDYTDMSDISYEGNNEISDLIEAFDTVKNKLVEVKALKKENESVIRKLREEEDYKKKFVKQLYDEKRENENIRSEAKRDGLTGLYNRRSFDAIIDEFIDNKPVSMEGALFLIDMDNFKNVNDTLGHLSGDEALKTLAGAMRVVFPGGYLGRYGGDEFIAFVTNTSSESVLEQLGASLCNKMDMMFGSGDKTVHLSVSIGIACTEGIDDYAELYMRADKALYYSKEHGRNQYTLASQIDI